MMWEDLRKFGRDDHPPNRAWTMQEIESVSTNVRDDAGEVLVAVREEGIKVEFVVLSWCSASDQGSEYEHVFHGYGYSGALRELRHSYWGEDGYIFYPQASVITSALTMLKEWFDVD